ncbi:MAG: hypothetical protein JM58_16760 [Peptococcaceae bacterium BICA1-8]|nr:MAG: hypothetical protein JM58_16760 [Peptococcaceae bacterium BICA1-8]
MKQRPKINSKLGKMSLLIILIIIVVIVYAIVVDPWNISEAPYGAGDYYYDEVEGYDFSISIGTKHPIIFFILFFGWAFGCWHFLKWMER